MWWSIIVTDDWWACVCGHNHAEKLWQWKRYIAIYSDDSDSDRDSDSDNVTVMMDQQVTNLISVKGYSQDWILNACISTAGIFFKLSF